MIKKESTTLVLVCRREFRHILERVFVRQGIHDFQQGGLSLVGGSTVGTRIGAGASEVFVLTTDAGSAGRLLDLLAACPIRTDAEDPFEVYTVGD